MNRGFRYFVLITIQDEVYTQRWHFASFFGTNLLFFQIYMGGVQGERKGAARGPGRPQGIAYSHQLKKGDDKARLNLT